MARHMGAGAGRWTGRGWFWSLLSVWPTVALAAATLAGAAYLCDEEGGRPERASGRAMHVPAGESVLSVAFGLGGGMLSSVGADGSVAVWGLDGGMLSSLPTVGLGQEHCAAFSPDGRLLAAGRAGGPVALYDPRAQGEYPLIDPEGATIGAGCMAFAPDGRTLAVGQRDGRISCWDVASRRRRSEWPGHGEAVRSLSYAPDGRALASSGCDRAVRLWDVATGRQRWALPDLPSVYVALAFTPDGRTLATADRQSYVVRLWDRDDGAPRAVLRGAEGMVLSVAISPDGRALAATDYVGHVHCWDLATGRLRPTTMIHPRAEAVAFAPDGRTLATGGFDGTVRLWDWPQPSAGGD